MKSLGIDLAGRESNPTGIAILEDREIKTDILHSDEEIIDACKSTGPDVVPIDAPLSFPEEGGLRQADYELIGRGYRVLPPVLGGMRSLTERGIRLAGRLRGFGFDVIEVHPRTSGNILFDSKSRDEWVSGILEEGWRLDPEITDHEIDSALAAVTGFLYLVGEAEEVGAEEGRMIIPRDPSRAL